MSVAATTHTAMRHAAALTWTALAIIAMLSGCGLWRGGERDKQVEPPRCITNFLSDSVHSTVLDSVVYMVNPGTTPQNVFTFTINYGDGTIDSITTHSKELFRFPHLYQSKGRYIATITSSIRGTMLCADTAIVVIQDYVQPMNATKIRIHISGITLHSYTRQPRAGMADSVWLSEEDDFELIMEDFDDEGKALPVEFINALTPRQGSFCGSDLDKTYSHGLWLPVRLSLDGDTLFEMRIAQSTVSDSSGVNRKTSRYVSLGNIPLKQGVAPTRARAVYSLRPGREHFDTFVPRRGVATTWTSADGYRKRSTAYISMYDDPEITVEFYR